MSKAEKFIEENTKNCSNIEYIQCAYNQFYQPWLTPDQAKKAVEIAREEMIEKALKTFQVVCNRTAKLLPNCETYCNACKQFKQAMNYE